MVPWLLSSRRRLCQQLSVINWRIFHGTYAPDEQLRNMPHAGMNDECRCEPKENEKMPICRGNFGCDSSPYSDFDLRRGPMQNLRHKQWPFQELVLPWVARHDKRVAFWSLVSCSFNGSSALAYFGTEIAFSAVSPTATNSTQLHTTPKSESRIHLQMKFGSTSRGNLSWQPY